MDTTGYFFNDANTVLFGSVCHSLPFSSTSLAMMSPNKENSKIIAMLLHNRSLREIFIVFLFADRKVKSKCDQLAGWFINACTVHAIAHAHTHVSSGIDDQLSLLKFWIIFFIFGKLIKWITLTIEPKLNLCHSSVRSKMCYPVVLMILNLT